MRFFIRRGTFYIITAWAAVTLNFFLPRIMPGDPVSSAIIKSGGQISPDAINSLKVLFGLDNGQSLWEQYTSYWGQLFRGDLGLSFAFFPTPVSAVIQQSLPWTVGLVGIATILSVILGTTVGTLIGWRRGTKADAVLPVATFFSAVPYFWFGLIAILLFAVTWDFFPASKGYQPGLVPAWNWEFISSVLWHGTLPALTIVVSSISGWILGMRNMMVTVGQEDYVTVAQAKGLKERRVMVSYAARNAVLPQISSFALALGFIVGGTLVMEMVFSYPGIGFVLYQAVNASDYPLMQGCFLVITLAILVANMMADVVYAFLDPRTRQEG
ncbi:ABC transporter permease [Demequina oxidasica]|uniref:ABC transporter permease n=1 Tax=Demequina oxidasica TaxID=676199 RepID=UPI0007831447|nr:ABC transporter permease [Demequina oxidasica]